MPPLPVSLVALPPPVLTALLDGDLATASARCGAALPLAFLEEGWLWRLRLDQVRADPAAQDWVVRAVVVPGVGVVGHAGFHGPPDADGAVEVGFTVLPHLRGNGYAQAALQALVARAAASPQVRLVRASVQPRNAASLVVVRRLGFVHVGEQVDEQDELELVHELTV